LSERASTVIPLPLSVVESNVWDVTLWPAFLSDAAWVRRTSQERYVIGVRNGRRVHEVPVVVRWQVHDHRISWQELEGPAWRGELRLSALNGRRTRVTLELVAQPRGLAARLAQGFGALPRDAASDLERLAARLSAIPQPVNPIRLAPTRRVGDPIGATAERRAPVRLGARPSPERLGARPSPELLGARPSPELLGARPMPAPVERSAHRTTAREAAARRAAEAAGDARVPHRVTIGG
jgi:hypothetical protein